MPHGLAQPLLFRQHSISGVCSFRLFLYKYLLGCSEMADPSKHKMRTSLRLGGFLGFVGGFLLAYQRSSGTEIRLSSLDREYLIMSFSPLLGLVREQAGGRHGPSRAKPACSGG